MNGGGEPPRQFLFRLKQTHTKLHRVRHGLAYLRSGTTSMCMWFYEKGGIRYGIKRDAALSSVALIHVPLLYKTKLVAHRIRFY
jgi:hypothetical protein